MSGSRISGRKRGQLPDIPASSVGGCGCWCSGWWLAGWLGYRMASSVTHSCQQESVISSCEWDCEITYSWEISLRNSNSARMSEARLWDGCDYGGFAGVYLACVDDSFLLLRTNLCYSGLHFRFIVLTDERVCTYEKKMVHYDDFNNDNVNPYLQMKLLIYFCSPFLNKRWNTDFPPYYSASRNIVRSWTGYFKDGAAMLYFRQGHLNLILWIILRVFLYI